jgi:hypothetical protein
MGHPQLCNLCNGSGVLMTDVRLRFHKTKGMLHTFFPNGMPTPEYLPRSVREKAPPRWWPQLSLLDDAPEWGPRPPAYRTHQVARKVA